MELGLTFKPRDLWWQTSIQIAQMWLSTKWYLKLSLAYVAEANKLYPTFIQTQICISELERKCTVPGKSRKISKVWNNYLVMQEYIGMLCIGISYQQSSSVNIFFSKWDFHQTEKGKLKKKKKAKQHNKKTNLFLCWNNLTFFILVHFLSV